MGARTEVCLVASPGGHLELLLALEEAWADRSRLFVVPPGAGAERLRARGERVHEIVNPWRDARLVARNVAAANAIVRRERPPVVVSSGAGVAVPLCLIARARGSRLLFAETMARVDGGSVSGRVLHRAAHAFFVQWPELLRVYPRAELCRPALLERAGADPAPPGEGTFVATGQHGEQFDRLLRLADEAVAAGVLPSPALAQVGESGYAPRHMEAVAYMAGDEVPAAIRRAAVVVSHGGAGLVSLALRHGRRPLVLPRRREHGEHLDDHQVLTTAKLASLAFAVSLEEHPIERAVELAAAPVEPPGDRLRGAPMAARLRELIDEALSGGRR